MTIGKRSDLTIPQRREVVESALVGEIDGRLGRADSPLSGYPPFRLLLVGSRGVGGDSLLERSDCGTERAGPPNREHRGLEGFYLGFPTRALGESWRLGRIVLRGG